MADAALMAFGLWLGAFTGAATFLLCIALWLRTRPHRTVFRLPPRRDDCFACRGQQKTFPISVDANGFDLPPGLGSSEHTAFLVVRVRSTPMGRLVDPFVEVCHGEVKYRQYFERGAAGRRHLNLSPLFTERGQSPVGRVGLRGGSIRLERDATLVLFDPPPIGDAPIVVLAPHPDDAEIAAFGIYQGPRSWVATITAGEMGGVDLSRILASGENTIRWNAFLRVWDSVTIPQLGGVPAERCLNLVYPDSQLRTMHEHVNRPARIACDEILSRRTLRLQNRAPEFQGADSECTWMDLVDDLRRLLDKAKPGIVVCPHPLIDEHPDHVFTAVALNEAIRDSVHANALFLLYAVHRRGTPVYPCGPADAVVSLPPWTEPTWLAESVYSHPLAPQVRTAKFFAIEAAHGLRACADDEPKSVRRAFGAVKREVSALFGGVGLRPASFLRRGPRPNEIFFVASAGALSELVERALAKDGSS